jgi:hypothetical protein
MAKEIGRKSSISDNPMKSRLIAHFQTSLGPVEFVLSATDHRVFDRV